MSLEFAPNCSCFKLVSCYQMELSRGTDDGFEGHMCLLVMCIHTVYGVCIINSSDIVELLLCESGR